MDYEEIVRGRNRSVTIGIWAPLSLVEVIDRIADSETVPTAAVILRLLRRGLKEERAEQEAAAKANGGA